MSTHKHLDRICAAALAAALLLTLLFLGGESLGIRSAERVMGYETRLFDTSLVHTIDIVMDDWDGFLQTAMREEYSACSVVIDGEAFKNVGIRGKGNTSLSTVASMDSNRYSFKIEFDQYDTGKTYHGLDKLSLNNLIQDNTCMKDYLTYEMMRAAGAVAPLCSFVFLTVNGEDWGLYLAVEAVEESFLQRSYGSDYGELYKPDSMNMGGGRGNGKDFNMEDFDFEAVEQQRQNGGMKDRGGMQMPGMDGFGGMGSGDAKLQYLGDDPDSYSTIFDSAKTDVSAADQARLIESLKALGSGDPETALDVEAVLRYFVVHNFVVNGDSYTGSMVHNYYLYEENGKLSMIPWDYNLAFGTFQGNNANSAVNDDIDAPLSVTGSGDRPMVDWIWQSEEYSALYHQYFSEFLQNVDILSMVDTAAELIAPYVERDPTAFCTPTEFESGVAALREFCRLRIESVQNQLSGSGETVDASHLNLSDMGTMNMGGGKGGDRGAMPEMPEGFAPGGQGFGGEMPQMPEGMEGGFPGGMTMPEGVEGGFSSGFTPDGQFPGDMTMPEGMEGFGPQMGGNFPGGDRMPQSGGQSAVPQMAQPTQGSSNLPVLLLTAAVLAGGLLFAALYRRRR